MIEKEEKTVRHCTYFFGISVEEEIYNYIPLGLTWNGAPQT